MKAPEPIAARMNKSHFHDSLILVWATCDKKRQGFIMHTHVFNYFKN